MTRAPVDTIAAPLFPRGLPWLNAPAGGEVSVIQRGRPMLVEFWDFCRPNSMRTLPYVKAWHERYHDDGLRVMELSERIRVEMEKESVAFQG